jgi:hypothetical protein
MRQKRLTCSEKFSSIIVNSLDFKALISSYYFEDKDYFNILIE